jgi:hypothetical protein
MARRARLAAVAVALALAAPSHARAEDSPPPPPVPKAARFDWDGTLVRISVGYREAIDTDIRDKLFKGLNTTIVMRAYLYEDGGTSPVALAVKSCVVAYDLWEELFRVQIEQTGAAKQAVPVVSLEGVLRRCAQAQAFALADYAQLKPTGRYFVQGIVEINPKSDEQLERIRQWVIRPAGATTIGPGDALFGSFVGLFVARIGKADRVFAFKTQAFAVPAGRP